MTFWALASWFFATSYLEARNSSFITLDSSSGVCKDDSSLGECCEVPITITGTYITDTAGRWDTFDGFNYNQNNYALQLVGAQYSNSEYVSRLRSIAVETSTIGQRGLSRDYAWNMVAWSSFTSINSESGMLKFYSAGDPGIIYAGKSVIAVGFASNSSDSYPCSQAITTSLSVPQRTMTVSVELGCDTPPCNTNPCPGILAPEAFGYATQTATSSEMTFTVDFASVNTALAVNQGILKISNLVSYAGDNSRTTLLSQMVAAGSISEALAGNTSSYYESLYAPMQPIYCTSYSNLNYTACYVRIGNTLAYPIASHYGWSDTGYTRPSRCQRSQMIAGSSAYYYCNKMDIAVGLIYYPVGNQNFTELLEYVPTKTPTISPTRRPTRTPTYLSPFYAPTTPVAYPSTPVSTPVGNIPSPVANPAPAPAPTGGVAPVPTPVAAPAPSPVAAPAPAPQPVPTVRRLLGSLRGDKAANNKDATGTTTTTAAAKENNKVEAVGPAAAPQIRPEDMQRMHKEHYEKQMQGKTQGGDGKTTQYHYYNYNNPSYPSYGGFYGGYGGGSVPYGGYPNYGGGGGGFYFNQYPTFSPNYFNFYYQPTSSSFYSPSSFEYSPPTPPTDDFTAAITDAADNGFIFRLGEFVARRVTRSLNNDVQLTISAYNAMISTLLGSSLTTYRQEFQSICNGTDSSISTAVMRGCAMFAFEIYGGDDRAVNKYLFQPSTVVSYANTLYNTKTMAVITKKPPTSLTEKYYSCVLDYWPAVLQAVGVANSTVSFFLQIGFFFWFYGIMLYLHKVRKQKDVKFLKDKMMEEEAQKERLLKMVDSFETMQLWFDALASDVVHDKDDLANFKAIVRHSIKQKRESEKLLTGQQDPEFKPMDDSDFIITSDDNNAGAVSALMEDDGKDSMPVKVVSFRSDPIVHSSSEMDDEFLAVEMVDLPTSPPVAAAVEDAVAATAPPAAVEDEVKEYE